MSAVQPLPDTGALNQPVDSSMLQPESVLVIACGALAREILQLKRINNWSHMTLKCLPADLHNRPELIPERLQAAIDKYRDQYERIFVGYADCGTGGLLDRLVEKEGLERLPGAHCYQFFAGQQAFNGIAEQELGSFYLTDFLARHFKTLIVKGMKLDQYPQLIPAMFSHYKRVVYLSQIHDPELMQAARDAADYLGLTFEHIHTGYGELESSLNVQSLKYYPST